MNDRPHIQVILGSTRPGRFSEKAGAWRGRSIAPTATSSSPPSTTTGTRRYSRTPSTTSSPSSTASRSPSSATATAAAHESIEQLRLVTIELEMAPLRHAVHILPALMVPAIRAEGEFDVELFASLDEKLKVVIDDLLWWATALGRARQDEGD